MKYLIIAILFAVSPIINAEEPERKRGEVTKIIEYRSYMPKTNKTTVIVWDGEKPVKVLVLTCYLSKVVVGRIFPYSIKRDRKGHYVSNGRKGL